MSKIIEYIRNYLKNEVKLPYILWVVVFLGVSIFLQYHFHLTSKLINPYRNSGYHFFANFAFYSLPLFFALFLHIYFYSRKDLLSNVKFWLTALYIIAAFSFRVYFYQHRDWITSLNGGEYDTFLIRCANQLVKALIVFISVFLFWKLSGHSASNAFYGFKIKGVNVKPYFLMLALMIPLIAIASTQADFLRKYPTFSALVSQSASHDNLIAKLGIYEFLYGFDYVAIELFFRGFMLYALSTFLGKAAILPMVSMYVFIHFGKPMGETISSFFGGMILGILAMETNSIIGGIIIHCGIAYMMEIGGFLGNTL